MHAERRGDPNIEVLTASTFSADLLGRGTPVLRLVTLVGCLNVVNHVAIDFRSGTETKAAKLNRFRKGRWNAAIEHAVEKWASVSAHDDDGKGTEFYSSASRTRAQAFATISTDRMATILK